MKPETMFPLYARFVQHRRYLMNVSPATLSWYAHAARWLPAERPTQDELDAMVITMRERGLKASGVNAATRALNSFLNWSGQTVRIQRLKEPQFIPPTFSESEVKRLCAWRPKTHRERRLHLFVLIALDTGARVSEILSVTRDDINFDDLLLKLTGKGRKQRIVPISLELRRHLFRYCEDVGLRDDERLIMTKRCAVLRAVKQLCLRLGFTPPPRTLHAFRSSFATNYIRRGGSVAMLQRILGHTTPTMTLRYVALQTGDLQEHHERLSLLNRT